MLNMTIDEMADELMSQKEYDSRNLDQHKQLSAEQMGKAEPDRLKSEPKAKEYLVSVNSSEQVSELGHIDYSAKHLKVTENTTIGEIFQWVEKVRLRSIHGEVDSITLTQPETIFNNQQKEAKS